MNARDMNTGLILRIKGWDALYETAETRKLENLRWVPVPNKHDGLGFRRVVQHRNRSDLLAAWLLIVQVASKGRRGQRGSLSRDGRALNAEDLSLMTGFPAPCFEQALTFFSDPRQGWLVADSAGDASSTATSASEQSGGSLASPAPSPAVPAASPAPPADSPAEGKGREGREGKGMEEIELVGVALPEAEAVPLAAIIADFHDLCPSFPRVSKITVTRARALKARWSDAGAHPAEWFRDLFRKAQASDFLSGRNGKWPGCSFDWLLSPANAQKVIEGNYQNKANGAAIGKRSSMAD